MSDIIQNLEKLNRKERYFLVRTALGDGAFKLGPSFRDTLRVRFSLDIPGDAFVAMDYHLNWIFAAAVMAFSEPVQGRIYNNKLGLYDGTQEDVDLLVAFKDISGLDHIIMLEAKGVEAYDNKQFEHKMERFRSIFGQNGRRFASVRPHFGLMSPHEPKHLRSDVCPSWLKLDGKLPWLPMQIPERLALFGCDRDGRADKKRKFWTLRHEQVRRSHPNR